MKIKKILLPLASIASVAAIVTPIAASCGNQKGEFHQDVSEYLKEGGTVFERTTPILEDQGSQWENDKATQEYLKAIKEDKQIFYDDVFEVLFGAEFKGSETAKGTAELDGSFGLTFEDADPTNMELSVGVFADLSGTVKIQQSGDTSITEIKFSVNGNMQLRNIPIQISYSKYPHIKDYVWSMQMAPQKFGEGFAIKGKGHAKVNVDDIDFNINLNCDYTHNSSATELIGMDFILNKLLSDVSLRIPYLKNVKGIEPTLSVK